MSDNPRYMKLFGDAAEEIDYENIDQDLLDKIAESILNKHQLLVPNSDGEIIEYRICEIEFYVRNEGHDDEYTHQDDHQKTSGKWYFHRTKSGNYKGGTYKGVDLTLGNEDTYFGVLIRSICSVEGETFIEGPCRCVNTILDLNDCKNVGDYMEDRTDPPSARSTKNFHIKRCRGLEKYDIYSGPRIGLSNKYPDFKGKPYRYVIQKDSVKKQKKTLELLFEQVEVEEGDE
jgi:3-methyladenine DNA glycosylase Mpg